MVLQAIKLGHRGVIQSVCVLLVAYGLFIYFSSATLQGPQRGPDSQWFIAFSFITTGWTFTLDRG